MQIFMISRRTVIILILIKLYVMILYYLQNRCKAKSRGPSVTLLNIICMFGIFATSIYQCM